MEEMEQNFDSLFSAAETRDLGDLQRAVATRAVPPSGCPSGGPRVPPSGSQGGSRAGSRGGSGQGSRGSPARKPTQSTLCPSNPAVTELAGSAASRSHSMRDQTSHMREKYQSKYSQRRMSNKNSSPAPLGSRSGSRNNSLQGDEVEVTRQFLATNKKVINRGDSFKRKERPVMPRRSNIEISVNGCEEERVPRQPEKIYRVVFLGSGEVGKTSIIDQFMSSEHADVYVEAEGLGCGVAEDRDVRTVSVDVNGEESRLSLIEAREDEELSSMEELNPDCYVVVYAVDDEQSFEHAKKCLRWLTSSNSLAGKSSILVGNKADLARSRLLQTVEGCDLAVEFGVKFTETSPGMGHHIDELLVGIVMQMRLREGSEHGHGSGMGTLKETVKGFFNILTGKGDEKRKSCRNLNI